MSTKRNISIIGGAGHIGFPLGLILSLKGFEVSLIDKNKNNIKKINNGVCPSAKGNYSENDKLKPYNVYGKKYHESCFICHHCNEAIEGEVVKTLRYSFDEHILLMHAYITIMSTFFATTVCATITNSFCLCFHVLS